MVMLFENGYFEVDLLKSDAIVAVTRTAKSFESLPDAHRACEPMIATLDALGRASHYLLLDSREAVGKNDPEYELWFARFRKELVAGFPRTAVVVRTVAGQLQSRRLLRADNAEENAGIFVDIGAALEFLRAGRKNLRQGSNRPLPRQPQPSTVPKSSRSFPSE